MLRDMYKTRYSLVERISKAKFRRDAFLEHFNLKMLSLPARAVRHNVMWILKKRVLSKMIRIEIG